MLGTNIRLPGVPNLEARTQCIHPDKKLGVPHTMKDRGNQYHPKISLQETMKGNSDYETINRIQWDERAPLVSQARAT